jgi:hypothetical protein
MSATSIPVHTILAVAVRSAQAVEMGTAATGSTGRAEEVETMVELEEEGVLRVDKSIEVEVEAELMVVLDVSLVLMCSQIPRWRRSSEAHLGDWEMV